MLLVTCISFFVHTLAYRLVCIEKNIPRYPIRKHCITSMYFTLRHLVFPNNLSSICKIMFLSQQKQSLLGSLEGGLNRVLDAITPKRGSVSGGPRKVKVGVIKIHNITHRRVWRKWN